MDTLSRYTRVSLLAVVGSLASIALLWGVDEQLVSQAVASIGHVLNVLVILGVLAAGVTPVKDPHDNDGNPLVPAVTNEQWADSLRSVDEPDSGLY